MEFLPKERSPWWFFYGGILALVSIVFLSFFLSEMLGSISAIIYLFVYTQVLAFLGFHGKKTWLFWGVAGHIIGVIMLANYGEMPALTSSISARAGQDDLMFCGTPAIEEFYSYVDSLFKIALPWLVGFFLGGIFQVITDIISAWKNKKS